MARALGLACGGFSFSDPGIHLGQVPRNFAGSDSKVLGEFAALLHVVDRTSAEWDLLQELRA